MQPKILLFLTMIFASYSFKTFAAGVSFGVLNTEATGLSLQRKGTHEIPSWHVSAYFKRKEYIQVNADLQFLYTPMALRLSDFTGAVYTGLGLRVENYAEQSDDEKYWLRFPIGLQWEARPMHLQIFAEMTLFAGPFPNTTISSSPALGLRVLL